MWIHVPSIPSQYAAVSEDWTLESEKLSQLERSSTLSGKHMLAVSWRRAWQNQHWMKRLSGLTSRHSILNRGVEKWICSLGDRRVKPSALMETKTSMTPETSSPTLSDLSKDLGYQSSFFSRTSPEYYPDKPVIITGIPLDQNCERWNILLHKDYSLRLRQGEASEDNDFSYWPTLTIAESHKIGNRPNYGQVGLSNHPAIVGYPERKKMAKSRKGDKKSTNPDMDSIHPTQGIGIGGKKYFHQIPYLNQPSVNNHKCKPKCRALNPNFCDHLMGLPIGWTGSRELAMPLYRQWRHSLSELLREN